MRTTKLTELDLEVPKSCCFKPGCLQLLRRSALLRPFAPSCALCALVRSFALFCAHLRSFARFCVFLRLTVFRTTAFGNMQMDARNHALRAVFGASPINLVLPAVRGGLFFKHNPWYSLLEVCWGNPKQTMKLQQPRNYDFGVFQFNLMGSQGANSREMTTSPPGHHRDATAALTTAAKLQQFRANSREMTSQKLNNRCHRSMRSCVVSWLLSFQVPLGIL